MFSLCHPWFTTTNLSYTFPILETSATASCGSTGTVLYGIISFHIVYMFRYRYILTIIEGSLNSKLPTIWTVEKQSRVVKSAERRCNSAKVRRKKIHPRQMLEKSRNAVFFQWFVCRVSWKVGLLKRRVPRSVLRGEIKKLHAAVAKRTVWSENMQNMWCSEHFLKMRCRKIARRCGETHIWSENVQNMWCSGHFLKMRCRKNARRCGETHVLKWKCTKHVVFGALFAGLMSKNFTPL